MATIRDIAKAVGVQPATVSYALNGKGRQNRISDQRVQQIEEMARQLGYRRNAAAVAVKQGRFGTIALLVSAQATFEHVLPILDGVGDRMDDHDLHLLFSRVTAEQLASRAGFPRLLREISCDGMLLMDGLGLPPALVESLASSHMPAIWLNFRARSDCVHPDDFDAGYQAGRCLLKLGHRRIAYAHYDVSATREADLAKAHYSVRDRPAGCAAALKEAGLPLLPGPRNLIGDLTFPARLAAAERLLSQEQRPTAIFCYHATDAEACLVAANRLGLQLPRDVSLICCAHQPWRALDTMLTTLVIPCRALGNAAVDRLLLKVADPDGSLPPVALPFSRVDGSSCQART